MYFKNNFFLFFTSVVIALVLLFFAVAIISYQSGFAENMVYINENGNFHFLGKNYKISENVIVFFEKYLLLCDNINSKIFPEIITSTVKNTAASFFDAAYGLTESFFDILFEITHGNM